MIGAVSASSAAPLRPITVKPLACQCMACAPQRVLASPAAPISLSAPAVSPSLNVAAGEGAALAANNKSADDKAFAGETALAPDKDKKLGGEAGDKASAADTEKTANGKELTQEEKAQLAKLRARDREVRAHEQAHAAAGGALAGAPSYSYQTGPDGKQYAVGGEVPIRASASSSNPRQAIAQLQQVARAATAPASPSGQDRAVAAQARAQIAELQAQLAQEAQAKAQEALQSSTGQAEEAEQSRQSQASGLPTLPDLPEIPKPAGASAPAAVDRPAAPRRDNRDTPPTPDGGAAPPVRDTDRDDSSTAGGPIEIAASRHAGPIAAYQQNDGPSKPPKIVGRIVSLNA